MWRKFSALFMSSALALALAGCGATPAGAGGSQASNNAKITIRIGNIYNENTTYGKALDKFKSEVEQNSGGQIKVQIFHNGTLGSEKDEIQSVRDGSLEMMETGTAGIGLYVPETSLFELWYGFKDINHLVTAFQSLEPRLQTTYQSKGFELLGAFYDGPRDVLSKRRIETLDQLKGLKLRVPGSKLYVNMANGLGAKAVTTSLSDVYTALQTGAIDGMEGTPDSIVQAKFYEQAKYLIQDQHVYQPLSIVYNKEEWDKLSDQDKKIITNAVDDCSKYQLSLVGQANSDALKTLQEKGVQLIQPSDMDKWSKAVASAANDFAKQFGNNGTLIMDKINQAQNQ